jgi:hypothetical protein
MDDFIAEALLKRDDSRLGEILLESYLDYDFKSDDGKLYRIIKSCFDSKEPRIYNPMQGFDEDMILPWEVVKLRK